MNYKMILQYDGTRYNGWQKQGNTDNTIQGKLETLLSRIAGEPVEIHCIHQILLFLAKHFVHALSPIKKAAKAIGGNAENTLQLDDPSKVCRRLTALRRRLSAVLPM